MNPPEVSSSGERRRSVSSRGFPLLLGLVISGVCMWWAARPILSDPDGWRNMVDAFRRADYRTLPVQLVVLFLFYVLKAWRWRLMLWPVGRYRPVRDLLGPIMIGFAMNNVLPARLGEFIRCFVFSRQQRVPLTVSLTSVVLERVFDGLTIVGYFAIGLLFIQGVDPRVKQAALFFAAAGLAASAGGLAYVIWTRPVLNLMEKFLRAVKIVPAAFADKVLRTMEAGARGLAALKDPRLMLGILLLSLVKWGLNGSLIWLSLWSFDIVVSPMVTMVLLGVIAFAVAAPAGPGFFGVIQACFTTLPALTGKELDPSAVFAASIYYHLAQYIPVTIVGLICFVKSGLDLSEVRRSGRIETEGVPPS